MVLFIIGSLIVFIVVFVFAVNNKININNMIWHFKHCNVLVGGAKGTGKDVVFDYVIKKRNDFYYANIDYSIGNNIPREVLTLREVSVYPNTYKSFIEDTFSIIDRSFYDGKDIYISDIGNFLPSYMDSTLYKLFPSMPILYSLSRHLYANNIHCNSQNIERGWKALREQAEFFIQVKRTRKLFGWLITTLYTYDKYDSAVKKLKPLKKRGFNKFAKANYDMYIAQNGDIRKCVLFQRIKKMSYDTRAFEKFLFDESKPRRIFDFKVWKKEYGNNIKYDIARLGIVPSNNEVEEDGKD